MRKQSIEFWKAAEGQDLIEYSLLLAFICLAGAAFFIGFGQNTTGIWDVVNSRLSSAAGS